MILFTFTPAFLRLQPLEGLFFVRFLLIKVYLFQYGFNLFHIYFKKSSDFLKYFYFFIKIIASP